MLLFRRLIIILRYNYANNKYMVSIMKRLNLLLYFIMKFERFIADTLYIQLIALQKISFWMLFPGIRSRFYRKKHPLNENLDILARGQNFVLLCRLITKTMPPRLLIKYHRTMYRLFVLFIFNLFPKSFFEWL